MQTNIHTLLNPQVLSIELVLVISLFLAIYLFASLKLNSIIGMFGFMVMVVCFVSFIMKDLELLWFWIMAIIESFLILLASIQYSRMRANT